jgi:hypothetical protein
MLPRKCNNIKCSDTGKNIIVECDNRDSNLEKIIIDIWKEKGK